MGARTYHSVLAEDHAYSSNDDIHAADSTGDYALALAVAQSMNVVPGERVVALPPEQNDMAQRELVHEHACHIAGDF